MTILQQKSEAFKIFFLMQFFKEVLRHSTSYDVSTLEKVLRQKVEDVIDIREFEKEKNRKKLKELIDERKKLVIEKTTPIEITETKPVEVKKEYIEIPRRVFIKKPQYIPQLSQRVKSPSARLPFELRNIMPVPGNEQVDLGILNPYLKDRSVSLIECNGPNILIRVRVGKDMRKTDIALSKEEIEGIINAFSRATRIPVNEGIFRVAVGRVLLTSQVSNETGSRFIISKIF